MCDFRGIVVSDLKWFPQSRAVIPVTPVRVQTPPATCVITSVAGRHAVELSLVGHPMHGPFVDFVRELERHAGDHAGDHARDHAERTWCSCVVDGLTPRFRLSAFSDTLFFDRDGVPLGDPTRVAACACLCELVGAWLTEDRWGLRWKVLELKACAAPSVPCMIMSCEGDDGVEGDPRGHGSRQLAQHVQPAVDGGKAGPPRETGRDEHEEH